MNRDDWIWSFLVGITLVLMAFIVLVRWSAPEPSMQILIDEPDAPAIAAATPSVGSPSDFDLQFITGAELCPLGPSRDPERIVHT